MIQDLLSLGVLLVAGVGHESNRLLFKPNIKQSNININKFWWQARFYSNFKTSGNDSELKIKRSQIKSIILFLYCKKSYRSCGYLRGELASSRSISEGGGGKSSSV